MLIASALNLGSNETERSTVFTTNMKIYKFFHSLRVTPIYAEIKLILLFKIHLIISAADIDFFFS